ncbi:MAG: hypothetical protein IJM62_06135 [Lachnospiraceae bacterium]|nr:hypothetical protein [Lachnospiraceae bacterium]
MKGVLLRWFIIVCGLFVFAFGCHLSIKAGIGVAPWDCLGMGMSNHLPFNYGVCMMISSVIILIIDILMKERIGFGTIIDAFITGNFVQLFNDIDLLPEPAGMHISVIYIVIGMFIMALGQFIYMKCAQGCGPRDYLLVAIGKRMRKVPIGLVQILLWGVVLLVGWLLGGPVGVGTLITTFGCGIAMQIVFSLLKFEPRDVEHLDVIQTIKLLRE